MENIEKYKEYKKLYKEGRSVYEIGRMCGVSHFAVWYGLKKLNVKCRDRLKASKAGNHKYFKGDLA